MSFRVLSIDGGGIRGIIPALILAEVESRAKRPVAKLFDLVAGTSTGGILAVGLAMPGTGRKPKYAARDLVGLYEEEGAAIFHRSRWHHIRAVGNLAEEKYPSDGIERVLAERFGKAWLSQVLTNVLVTAYDIELRQPHFFKSDRARKKPERDFHLADIARATSAAPTYFEPAQIRSRAGDDPVTLVDGGVFANNPAACALVESICTYEAKLADITFLSLGTGELTRPILYEEAKGWGLAKWAQPILSVVFDGVSDTVDFQVQSLLGTATKKSRYLRIQAPLHEGNDDMDDASRTNIKVLKLLAKELIATHSDAIDDMVARLTR
ncbi:MAG: CBASS cGAMP-activated phospholipase [Gemmatimonadales bacterium]